MINKYHVQVLVVEAAAIVLAACAAFIVMWARTLSESSRAQAFLTDVTKLQVGKSTLEDAKLIAQKHRGLVEPGSGPCGYEACTFEFIFENKPLSSTYIEPHIGFIGGIEVRTGVPYVGLIGALDVRNGVVTKRQIGYFRYGKRPFAYNVWEMVLPEGNATEAEAMRRRIGLKRMKVDSAGIPSAVSVDFEPSISADEKRRAYAINVSCLSKIFGCSGPAAIFPSAIPYRGIPYQTNTQTW
jgi:hypothetical protein